MNLLSVRRDLRLAGIVGATASLVAIACGGSSSTNTDVNGNFPGDGGAASSSGGSSSGGSSSGSATSSSGGSVGSSSGGSSSGGTVVTDASVSPDDSGSSTGKIDASACSATASEVVMVGDSYLALSGEITAHLESLATAGGALASGSLYRHYYKAGANMYTGYTDSVVTPIPTQFNQAVTAGADIKYVIMDGGGNDILLENPTCIDSSDPSTPTTATCAAAVQNAITTANTLFTTMKAAGVEKVIYFFYPHLPTTQRPDVNVMMDYAYPLVKAACDNAPLPCYFIDTRASFEGHAEYIGSDDIHPTTAGSDVIAGLIWDTMQQQCVAL